MDSLSEEVKTLVLQQLDLASILRMSLVNSRWHSLSRDEQIWRRLLHLDFSPQARRLPPKQQSYRALYRLATNWRTGRASPVRLSLRSSVLPAVPRSLDWDGREGPEVVQETIVPDTIVAFRGQYIFTAPKGSDTAAPIPSIRLEQIRPDGSSLFLGPIASPSIQSYYATSGHLLSPSFALAITEMRLNDAQSSRNPLRLAIFYSSGQYVLLRIDLASPSGYTIAEEYAQIRVDPDPVALARFHLPLLVTVTKAATLRFYLIKQSAADPNRFKLTLSYPSLRSDLVWHPTALSLKRTSKRKYKASFVYATPYFSYPSSWTLAVQEFHLSTPKNAAVDDLAIDTFSATCVPHQSTSQPLISAIHQSGSYIVASRLDNTIELYEVLAASARQPLELVHRRTMFGHSCSVSSVMLQDSRMVSAGKDGKLRVWDLQERGHAEGVEVIEAKAPEQAVENEQEGNSSVDWLSFDAEKIVCLESPSRRADRLRVLSFAEWQK